MVEYILVEQVMIMEQEWVILMPLYLVSSMKGGRGERTWRDVMLVMFMYT